MFCILTNVHPSNCAASATICARRQARLRQIPGRVQAFVHQPFAKDPVQAIAVLVSRSGPRNDVALGQLLLRTPLDADRAWLGKFLPRRSESSKVALKAYVDSFGLTGLRINKSLRVFLQSILIPAKAPAGHSSPLEYLLEWFTSRWYEANMAIIAYDKDLAIRLVCAIVQLNEVIHAAIYASVRREKLAETQHPSSVASQPDIVINVKHPLPPRLTYRMQFEPILLKLRIPQPDLHPTIQPVFGQDLLGNKTIIMWRSGPNVLAYTGLPLSSPVPVERSFMRNTFQVFVSHTGLKRSVLWKGGVMYFVAMTTMNAFYLMTEVLSALQVPAWGTADRGVVLFVNLFEDVYASLTAILITHFLFALQDAVRTTTYTSRNNPLRSDADGGRPSLLEFARADLDQLCRDTEWMRDGGAIDDTHFKPTPAGEVDHVGEQDSVQDAHRGQPDESSLEIA
ncbi:Sec7 domain-containing protein [Lenzites betulinus]|nr:Sec7 domain-containing protein [Lenzites betulinus]